LNSYSEFCCLDKDDCILCDGADYNTQRVIPVLNQTCGFLDAVPLSRINQTCPVFKETFSFYCGCPNAAQSCSICPGDALLGAGDKRVFGLNDVTCRDLDDLASLFSTEECGNLTLANFTESLDIDFDIAGYCQCGGDSSSIDLGNCSLCGGDDLPIARPDAIIPASGNFTCAELADFALSVRNATTCSALREGARAGCCDVTPSCSVCDADSTVTLPNRTIVFAEGATCEQLDGALLFAPDGTCDDVKDQFPIDLASWCGCTGADVPDECTFCPNGTALANSSATIPGVPFACGEAEDIARHVTNSTFCESAVKAVAELCCTNAADGNDRYLTRERHFPHIY